jgi:hypothetical protein
MATTTATRKTVKKLTAMQQNLAGLSGLLYSFLMSKGATGAASTAWNEKVLELVVGTLERGDKLADLYATIQEILPHQVASVGLDAGADPELVGKLRDQADNTISQLNGPFWVIEAVRACDGTDYILSLATNEDATWSTVRRFVKERVEELAYDSERANVQVSFTPRGTDHAVTFTVEQAALTRDQHKAAVAQAETIKADNSPHWGAVMRQYRQENPCDMLDRRTRGDRDKEATELGRAILNKVSPEQIAALLK